jgi:hypothetical protein
LFTPPSGYIAVFLLFGYIHFIIAFLRRDILTTGCGQLLAVAVTRECENLSLQELLFDLAIRYDLSNNLFLDAPSGIGYIGDVLFPWFSRRVA